jgi:hypothetical protein
LTRCPKRGQEGYEPVQEGAFHTLKVNTFDPIILQYE